MVGPHEEEEPEATSDAEAYAFVASAMEHAFEEACEKHPELTRGDLFVALLLLKDRILERHLPPESLPPELRALARELYEI